MGRDFYVNGESLVLVKGNLDVFGQGTHYPGLWELGLTSDKIRITPTAYHADILTSDYGREVPADVGVRLAEVNISMTLVHYDPDVLDACVALSLGYTPSVDSEYGRVGPAGKLLGAPVDRYGGNLLTTSGYNSYVSLNIRSPVGQRPWRFPHSYLAYQPVEVPLGVEKSLVRCNWRAIPHRPPRASGAGNFYGEIISSGSLLWDRVLDQGEVLNQNPDFPEG